MMLSVVLSIGFLRLTKTILGNINRAKARTNTNDMMKRAERGEGGIVNTAKSKPDDFLH